MAGQSRISTIGETALVETTRVYLNSLQVSTEIIVGICCDAKTCILIPLGQMMKFLATPNSPACSSRNSGYDSRLHTVGASRVAHRFLFQTCRRHYPGGTIGFLSLYPSARKKYLRQRRPSPNLRRVGSHITRFEACSTFTRVTACLLPNPSTRAFS
jgi:hypothetical protein